MELTSPAFGTGERVPERYVRHGENLSPPLVWSGIPSDAKSLALICIDPDAPQGVWHHWALFDLPPDRMELPEGYPRSGHKPQVCQAVNDFHSKGYDGPAPPPGHGVHHYHFRLLALDLERLPLSERATCSDVVRETANHTITYAELIGTYSR